MDVEEKRRAALLVERPPRRLSSYWPFTVFLLLLAGGVTTHVAIFATLESRHPGLEICLRQGERITPIWESGLVRGFIGTTLMCFLATFTLGLLLAARQVRVLGLLRSACEELGIVGGRERDRSHGSGGG